MTKAAVCRGLNADLVVEEIDVGAPKEGEIRLRVGASGVCHSDLSIVNGTLFGSYPIVLGHEGAGIVTELGPGVDDFAIGDHVVISWVPQCGRCFFCRSGQPFLCTKAGAAIATGGLLDGTSRYSKEGESIRQMTCAGTFSEEVVVPTIGAVRIPEEIDFAAAALIGCAVLTGVGAAINTADIQPGATVAVFGCGGVGLNVIQGALLAGAERVIAVDMVASKLETARHFGATDAIDAGDVDPVFAIKELTKNRGADVGFEVIGLKTTIDQTINAVRRGGEVVLVGVPRSDVIIELPALLSLVISAKTIKGCWYGSSDVRRDVPKLIAWYQEGKLKLDELVSRRIDLDQINEAFRAMEAGEVARSVVMF